MTAGREVAKAIVNVFYSKATKAPYRGRAEYEYLRELLLREEDVDAVVVSPPDYSHADAGVVGWDAKGFQRISGSIKAKALLKPTYREPWGKFAGG